MRPVILNLIAVLHLAWSLEWKVVEPPLRVDMQPPEETLRMSTRNVELHWITMPIDHFDPTNIDTYQMRYMINEEFFAGNGSPIFIMVGGEWTIAAGWLMTGNMYEMARENRGYMVYTEHRYYGQSLPYQSFTAANLRFLSVEQALADLAHFIGDLKKQPRFANSTVILYGGSYAANMALWFKQRYPHLILGSVASSGPIFAKMDYFEYLEVVHEAFLLEGGAQCIAHIRQGIQDTVEAMKTEEGRERVNSVYRTCVPINYENRLDMGYFAAMTTWSMSGAVQTARPGTLIDICNRFHNNEFGPTPMEQIAGFIFWRYNWNENTCMLPSFDSFVNQYQTERSESRAWYYQTCTEYGYFQTAPSSGTVFDPLEWLDADFYIEVCRRAFDTRFDRQYIEQAAERSNVMFGGLGPVVNNTINIHGYIDPWRALGVYEHDILNTSPTFTVPRASHCFDMQPWLPTDTIQMTNAQQTARRIVSSWLA